MVKATATTMGVVFAPGDTQRAQQTTKDRELHVRGGMHLEPERGFYERAADRGVCELDFESMHPSVVITRGICPTGKGVLPKLMESLLDNKRVCENSEAKNLMVRRAFFKSIMVCTTGWLGRKLANGGDSIRRECYGRILQATRDILTETIEACNKLSTTEDFQGLCVVYGVTDSVFVMTPVGEAADLRDALSHSAIRPSFGGSVNLCVNRVYETLLLIKKNQYCGYDTDNRFKQIGLLRSTQHTNERIVINASYEALLAPNPVILNIKLHLLSKTLDTWPQWRPSTQDAIQTLRRACGTGPLPTSLTKVIELVGCVQPASGPKCRTLLCYST
jgi:DNA polymerase elongation subunit (family B)